MIHAAAHRWTLIGAAAAIGCWFVPLVHVRPLGADETDPQSQPATAAELAEQFWSGPLANSHDRAHPANAVLTALTADAAAAREEYGRTVGVSRSFLVHLRGEGTVTSVERKGIGVDVSGDGHRDLLLLTGPIFGAAVRDATGLLTADQASNSQQFNEVANELNLIVETQVAPTLREQPPGQVVRFVACAEVKSPSSIPSPLPAVPVFVEATATP
ncbi:hypothetical protein KOR34_51070 [Posidoniimonas corsicana]|uniref:Periplasmic lipoprotein n=1 Tax=Posidoniimonas corsicana TaxID=1938618 RepID=A0A5C5UVE2_9BACT|nr:DUF2291 family protein [Posidoniimonas corsicana]TWT29789.1 hypothetical protein KOR34_51070 [Posidoniimonas corsicana]